MNNIGVLDLDYIFTKYFDEETFREFSINLVNLEHGDLLGCRAVIDDSEVYKTHVEYIKDIGKYKDEKNKTILISMIKLKDSPEKARTMQRNFIAKHIKALNTDAALVGLYSEHSDVWRISFVKLDYTFDMEGLKETITPAKRYSYLIEPHLRNHTAQEQLGKLFYNDDKKPSVEEIEEVFSVQSVTDEFFKMYKEKYLDLKELLESCSNFVDEGKRLNIKTEDFSEEFAKKLMGQIAFLYFLQKKGWLGVRIVPKKIDAIELEKLCNKQDEETRKIIKRVYYRKGNTMHLFNKELKILNKDEGEILASVFKNTKYDEEWGSGTRSFIRTIYDTAQQHNFDFFNDYLEPLFYNALNKRRGSTEYYHLFNCKIPFLNGGLFEPIYNYDWEKINIEIPNEFFSNEDEKGLLDLFDMYNFTINEDEPLEKEVAVDPEMLGKIFENLLEIKERKSKGAFYTPREIVHYMCQESLINYLVNKTNIDEKSIELFIKYGDIIKDEDFNAEIHDDYKMPKIILDNIKEIDEALATVTVVDPAVGSGAFPLGMLSEIVKARNIITSYLAIGMNEWNKRELFEQRNVYKLKKDTMKKSIFAVDIEPSAIDIAKLRLWLSLVVDAEVKTVNTLPNLDYNIMVGNSLIDEYEGIKLFDEELLKERPKTKKKRISNQIQMNFNNSDVEIGIEQEAQILEDIQSLQAKLFDIKVTSEKLKIKDEIEQKEWELIEYKLAKENKQKELKNLKKTRHENRRPYFLWKLEFSRIFKYNGGFDIVIGNPPYIDSEYMMKYMPGLRKYCKDKYRSAKGNWDIFIVFIELSVMLAKNLGNASYIVPNKLVGAKYSEEIRKLIGQYTIKELRDYSSVNVFKEADVYPIVFRLEKSLKKDDVCINIMEDKDVVKSNISINKNIFYKDIFWDRYFVDDKIKIDIIEKVMKFGTLEEIATVKGAATVGEAYDVKEVMIDCSNVDDVNMVKFINTGTIDRYKSLWGEKYTKYIKGNYSKPCIYIDDIEKINKIRYLESKKSKIIIGGMNKELECYLDYEGKYLAGKSTTIVYDSKLDLRYIIGILNSKLITFYYKQYFSSLSLSGGYLRIGPPQIKEIPISYDEEIYTELIKEVDRVIEFYKNNKSQNITTSEENINNLVYKLYKINNNEINVIENS